MMVYTAKNIRVFLAIISFEALMEILSVEVLSSGIISLVDNLCADVLSLGISSLVDNLCVEILSLGIISLEILSLVDILSVETLPFGTFSLGAFCKLTSGVRYGFVSDFFLVA